MSPLRDLVARARETSKRRRWSGAIALVCAIVVVAAVWVLSSGGAAPLIALGVNLDGGPGRLSAVANYVREVGRKPAAIMWYQDWSGPLFLRGQIKSVAALGATPIITWLPIMGQRSIPLRAITEGRFDSYLAQSAGQARAWGRPIFIRFAHEMNLPKSQWGVQVNGNTPAQYVAAWRHVVALFRKDGATNVRWVWSPEVEQEGLNFGPFFPGDRWVNWVALDGYNWGRAQHHPKWESVAGVFLSSYRALERLSRRPVMLGETASTEVGGNKGDWIRRGLLHAVPTLMPRVRAVVWFDRDKEADWRFDSSRSALAAFRSVAQSAIYQGALS